MELFNDVQQITMLAADKISGDFLPIPYVYEYILKKFGMNKSGYNSNFIDCLCICGVLPFSDK